MLPGDWDLAHAIRLGIKPFAELGANSEALSGSQVDSSCSCRAIFESAPGSDATVSNNPLGLSGSCFGSSHQAFGAAAAWEGKRSNVPNVIELSTQVPAMVRNGNGGRS